MRVLQLCYKPPFPSVDGGTLAMNSVTQGLLRAGVEVKVVSICSDKHPVQWNLIDETYRQQTSFEALPVDLSVHIPDAAIALLCGESYNVKRFYNKVLDTRLAALLQSEHFDIIQVESIFMAPYLPTMRHNSQSPILLRAHNVEHRIWRQLALSERNPAKRWYLKKLALALRHYELDQINHFDGIVCITPDDASVFKSEGCHKPITDIPFGIDLPEPLNNAVEPNSLFHIGSMDWQPNIDAIHWLLEKVWPLLHHEMPQLRLYLAGRKMPDDLKSLHSDGVEIVGEVTDASTFMASKQLNLVPLQIGSGLRIKIIEAMALGKTVISTATGASGIECSDGEHLLLANTPEAFVEQVRRCITHPDWAIQIGKNARQLIEKRYTTTSCTQRFLDFYNKIAERTLCN